MRLKRQEAATEAAASVASHVERMMSPFPSTTDKDVLDVLTQAAEKAVRSYMRQDAANPGAEMIGNHNQRKVSVVGAISAVQPCNPHNSSTHCCTVPHTAAQSRTLLHSSAQSCMMLHSPAQCCKSRTMLQVPHNAASPAQSCKSRTVPPYVGWVV